MEIATWVQRSRHQNEKLRLFFVQLGYLKTRQLFNTSGVLRRPRVVDLNHFLDYEADPKLLRAPVSARQIGKLYERIWDGSAFL